MHSCEGDGLRWGGESLDLLAIEVADITVEIAIEGPGDEVRTEVGAKTLKRSE